MTTLKKKQVMSFLGLVLIVFCTLFFQVIKDGWFSFFPLGSEYGVAYNNERLKRGILPIPESWCTCDNAEHSKTWKPSLGEGVRKSKIVVADKEGIDSEVDYLSRDGCSIEMIYSYGEVSNPWRIALETKGKKKLITKAQADSVLLEWGILH
jgi:hypothetical protein